MNLWQIWKGWREVRGVVVVGVLLIAMLCIGVTKFYEGVRKASGGKTIFSRYTWSVVDDGSVRNAFVMMCLIAGGGGLLQESKRGTAWLSLSLPTTKKQMVAARAMAGAMGVAAMALTPAVVLPVASWHYGQNYPVVLGLEFALLWTVVGTLFYALAFLVAHCLEGELSAVLVGVPLLMGYSGLTELAWMQQRPWLNLFHVMNGEGMPYFDETRIVFTGAMPWVEIAVILAAATAMVMIASWRMEQRDFS